MTGVSINVGPTLVGGGRPPLVVAELSGNHRGSLETAMRIVRAAAASGADAIKLQTYTPGSLTVNSERPEFFIHDPASPWHGRRLWDLYEEAHTPWEWTEPLFAVARAEGLACLSTAFDLSSLDYLLAAGVDAIKIASFEAVHIPLIEASAQSGKPVLISAGMASVSEIDDAVAAMRATGCDRFVLLKCTSAYPACVDDAHLLTMVDMRSRYGCEVGFSDHTLTPHAAFAATALGAAVIEKHLTMDRSEGGVDSAFSIEPVELQELVQGCGLVWQSLGDVHYGPVPAEQASLRERCSIYIVQPVKKGERFTASNVRIIRPASGLAPKHYSEVLGRTCNRDIEGEVPLSWEMVNWA